MDNVIGCAQIVQWLKNAATMITNHREELTALDAAIGDADHGANHRIRSGRLTSSRKVGQRLLPLSASNVKYNPMDRLTCPAAKMVLE